MTAAGESRETALFRFIRLAALMSGGPLAAMALIALVPTMTQLADRFSADGADGAFRAQLVLAVAAPAMVVGGPLSGWLAERLGKRRVFLASLLIFAIAGCGGALAPDFWTLIATRVLLGFAAVALTAVGMGLLTEYYTGPALDRLIGLVTFVGSFAALVILPIAGELAKIGGWQGPFALFASGFVVFLLALPTVFEKTRASHAAEAEDASIKSAVPIFALTVALAFLMYMPTVQGPDVLKQKGITDPTALSTVVMVMSIGTMATSFMFGAIRRRLGFLTIQMISFGLQGIGIAGFGVVSNVVALSALAFVAGLGSGFIQPLTQSEILAKVPPAASSRAVGLSMAALMAAQLLNPFLVKPLRSSFGAENAFLYIGLAGIAAAVLTLAWRAKEGMRRPATAE